MYKPLFIKIGFAMLVAYIPARFVYALLTGSAETLKGLGL